MLAWVCAFCIEVVGSLNLLQPVLYRFVEPYKIVKITLAAGDLIIAKASNTVFIFRIVELRPTAERAVSPTQESLKPVE